MVGCVGIGLLATYSYAVYQVDCTGTLGYMFPINVLGVAAMAVCGMMLLVAGSDSGWQYRVAGVVSIFAIPAVFFLVINPLAAKQRVLRHTEEMNEKIPILNRIVAHVDASNARLGHIPADEDEFYRMLSSDLFSDDDGDWGLGCCWIIRYDRTDSERYQLRYLASDVSYAYDSDTPERGWYPIAAGE